MKRTPKKPPKPPSAADLKAEERQRMISSDLEQIRRYIGEIARLMASYRAENVALRKQLAEAKSSASIANYSRNIGIPPILRPQDFATELPEDG